MNRIAIAALLASQLLPAPAAVAADLTDSQAQQMGAFAGFRLRVPVDGSARPRQVRAGFTLAPTMHRLTAGGEVRMRIGEGLELGLVGREPVRLSLGGTPVSRLARGPAGPDGERLGVSTLGWVAIGVGVAAIAAFVAFQACVDGEICGSDRDP